MSDWVDVADLEEFDVGTSRLVDVEGAIIAVFNLGGHYHAIEDVCTHDGGTLSGGEIKGDCIVCPRHGAVFSIITGDVLAPPAYEPVATFPVRVHQGRVQVRDDRWG
jgi:3-phenylpropionate/trans-cinnamate dioxygenase ferredoxin subunit